MWYTLNILNPLSPGGLDPENYLGGFSGATAIFWLFGAFLCPLVSMLNQILNKGVIIDHVEKKIWQNLKNPLIYDTFRLQVKKIKGPKRGYPLKIISKFLVKYLSKVII